MTFFYGFMSLLSVFLLVIITFSGVSSLNISFYGGLSLPLEFSVLLDLYGLGFGIVVGVISFSVMLFSDFYMDGEPFNNRFSYLIIIFVTSMFVLLISGGMVSLIIGWDGLGLVSFLLVVYYESKSSLAAGMLTAISNRVGDVLFILSLGFISSGMVFNFSDVVELGLSLVLIIIIFMASITNSAQIPFSAWLPAAMAAPTPVSTLVHSSTLVTAGLFVLIRFSEGMSGAVLLILLILSGFTCVIAGGCAVIEPDLKNVVALSTLSQLGVMGVALSMGDCDLAFFHLVVHALFKALIFMCVGCFIMSGYGVQECRSFSGLYFNYPIISGWLVISCLSLSGFPFMAGFFSKDLVMEGLFDSGLGLMVVGWVYLSCALTCYYSCRLVGLILIGEGGTPEGNSSEEGMEILCTSSLGVISVIGGSFFQCFLLECSFHCEVSSWGNIGVIMSLIAGLLGFFLGSTWDKASGSGRHSGLIKVSSHFFGGMFFLRGFSGSHFSGNYLSYGMAVSELETSYDFYLGENMIADKMKAGTSWAGADAHFGVWVFLGYYFLVVGVISAVFFIF